MTFSVCCHKKESLVKNGTRVLMILVLASITCTFEILGMYLYSPSGDRPMYFVFINALVHVFCLTCPHGSKTSSPILMPILNGNGTAVPF